MQRIELSDIVPRELAPGFLARILHSARMTQIYWDIREGSDLPLHSHPPEQIVNLLEGTLELVIGGETETLKPGSMVIIPPDVPHSGKAVTRCRVLDVFCPVREDLKEAG